MSTSLLQKFDDLVMISKKSERILVWLDNETRFIFLYDNEAGKWVEFLASCPLGVVSEEDRSCANELLNLYLFVLK